MKLSFDLETAMFLEKLAFVIVCTIFVLCNAAYLDTLPKCGVNDGDCQGKFIQKVLHDIGKTGLPELNIDPIDPVHLENITVSVLNVIDITLVEGAAKGFKNCAINKFRTSVEDGHSTVDITCDVTVKGKYKMFSESPLIKSVLGGESVHGEGNGKIKIEKLNIKFDIFFTFEKRGDDIYLKPSFDKTKYVFDILGKLSFTADNLYVGDVESSKLIVGLLNDNWRILVNTVGKPFMDKALTYVYEFTEKIFNNIPTKYYLTDDLTPYLSS